MSKSRNDVPSVKRRREVALENVRDHMKKEKDAKPEHTAKHKAEADVLEERIRSSARARRYIQGRRKSAVPVPVPAEPTGPEDEVRD